MSDGSGEGMGDPSYKEQEATKGNSFSHTFISHDDFYGPSVSWLLSIIHEDSGDSSGIFSQLERCPQLRGVCGGRGKEEADLAICTAYRAQILDTRG